MSTLSGSNQSGATAQAAEVAQAVQTLSAAERKNVVMAAAMDLPAGDQQDIIESFRPTRSMTDWLYLIVILAFAIVLVGSFATLAISVFASNTNSTLTQTILTMFTSVVGFLAGLFVPSPIAGKSQNT